MKILDTLDLQGNTLENAVLVTPTGDVPAHATDHQSGGSDALALGSIAGTIDDTQHGARAGGTLHATAIAAGAAGFMTGADKTKLDGIASGATANTGTVTSVALTVPATEMHVDNSPITGSGTLAIGWEAQTANKVLASPSGASGTPAFRALVAADMPIVDEAHGGNGVAAIPRFSAYKSSSQSIANATFTKVAFQNEDFDSGGYYDNATNYRFTPLIAGTYLVQSRIGWSPTLVNQKLLLSSIYKNGSRVIDGTTVTSGTGDHGVFVAGLVALNGSTDYIELYAYQETGGSASIYGGTSPRGGFFSAIWVGP